MSLKKGSAGYHECVSLPDSRVSRQSLGDEEENGEILHTGDLAGGGIRYSEGGFFRRTGYHKSMMRILWTLLTVLILTGLMCPLWAGAENPPMPWVRVDERSSEFRSYTLPAGTPLAIVLQTPLSTAINRVNDEVEAAVTQDFYLGPHKMLSKHARLTGSVSICELPIQGRNGVLGVRFHELSLKNGERLPIQAYVKTNHPQHIWGGELTPGTEYKRVSHRVMGIGVYNQAVLAGPRQMGAHIELPPGERLTVILQQPVTIVVPQD